MIALLPPAPRGWVEAAKELPRIERGLEQILALAETDAEFRRTLLTDLEQAVQQAGLEPDPELVHKLQERLSDP